MGDDWRTGELDCEVKGDIKPHPATYSKSVMEAIGRVVLDEDERHARYLTLLDPFAGTGGIHVLGDVIEGLETVGLELEPEWASHHERTRVGDIMRLGAYFDDGSFDLVVTSPCYGNRMADHHDAKDDSTRNTYRHQLGRMPSDGSSAVMQWGKEYRTFHRLAWFKVWRVLKVGGLFVLNVSNHIRQGKEQLVMEWHLQQLLMIGFKLEGAVKVATPRNRFGQNGEARVDGEWVLSLRKTEP